MANTDFLKLPLVEGNQAQKHVTINDAFGKIDTYASENAGGGGSQNVKSAAVEIEPSGVSFEVSGIIPARVIVFGVYTKILEAVGGVDQVKIGRNSGGSDFGGFIWHEPPSENIGVVGSFATYSPQSVWVSSQDDSSAMSGGLIRLVVTYLQLTI